MSSIQTALVGAGLMGYWHGEAVRRLGGRVVAVADRELAVAEKLAGRHKGARAFGDVAEMLAEVDFAVWHVCTPPESHVGLLALGLPAGKHALIEKPLAPTAPATQHLYALAQKHQRLICPVHQFPFQRGVAYAKQSLNDIGRVVSFDYTVRSAGAEGLDSTAAERIALDIFPHAFSLIQALLPTDVAGVVWQVSRTRPGEWLAHTNDNGLRLTITVSMNARPTTNHCLISGTAGTIWLDLFHGYAFRESGAVSRWHKIAHPFTHSLRQLAGASQNLVRRTVAREPAYPGLRTLCQQFYGAVAGTNVIPITPAEALAVAVARDQIARAGGVR